MSIKSGLIINLSDISNEDKDLVGEKAASLGEMLNKGFPFHNGFVITKNAYHQFALKHKLPDKLIKQIFRSYKRLESPLKDAAVEIFPSNMKAYGEAVLVEKIKSIWLKNPSPIVVRKIPQTSNIGVMFTINPTHSDKTKILIYEGETGNHYEVLKKDLKIAFKAINNGEVQKLTDKQIINLAALGKKLQEYCYFPQEVHFAIEKNKIFITQTKPITHLSLKFKAPSFAKASAGKQSSKLQRGVNNRKLLLKGNAIYPGIATGHLRIIQSIQDINKILRGEIVVIPYQDLIKHPITKAGAIVATDDRFHHMPHFTAKARFSGKPALITTPNEAKKLKDGVVVTVNGKNGEVYVGSLWQ